MKTSIHVKKPLRWAAWLVSLGLLAYSSISNVVMARSISPLPQTIASKDLFRDHINSVYYFYATGSSSDSIYGDGVYTDDSSIAKAAVHAGVLALGQKGVIKVTVLPGQDTYAGSTKNGVTSNSYGNWGGSFKVAADDGGDNGVIPAPNNMAAFQDYPGEVYLFALTADGGSTVWGSNVYTYDTYLAAAAVHAGVLTDGAVGTVRVVMGPKQSIFLSSYNAARTLLSNAYTSSSASYTISDPNAATPLVAYPGTPQNPLELRGSDNLNGYKDFVGGSYYFSVTGNTSGQVWGTNVYTYDSVLASAAVHAGLVGVNATALVKATLLPNQSNFVGSTRNGVTSNAYSSSSAAYSLGGPDGSLGTIPVINSPASATYVPGQSFDYRITATGSPSSYSATGLPKGLSVNKNTGGISGFPQLTGRFAVELQASNKSGTGALTLILTVPGAVNTTDCLFGYAERIFPGLFSGGTGLNLKFEGYDYRYYKNTNTYLGIYQGQRIDLLQANVSSNIINVGTVEQYKPITGCK